MAADIRIARRVALCLALIVCSSTRAGAQVVDTDPLPLTRPTGPAAPWQAGYTASPQIHVNLATGGLVLQLLTSSYSQSATGPGHALLLSFNSLGTTVPADLTAGFALGTGWSSNFGTRLEFASPTAAIWTRGDGTEVRFELHASSWSTMPGHREQLEPDGSGWRVRTSNQGSLRFDSGGTLLGVDDAVGNTFTLAHQAGRLVSATEPSGRSATFLYANGHLDQVVDAYGNAWDFGYDGAGRLAALADPEFGALAFGYHADGRLASFQDHDGGVWTFEYHADAENAGRIASLVDPAGHTRAFDYDIYLRTVRTRMTDARGGVWRSVHDREESPTLERRVDPLGNVRRWEHDAERRLQTFTDERDHTWSYAYDVHGNVTLISDPLGRSTSATYDALDNLTSVSADGATTWFHHDDSARPTLLTSLEAPAVDGQPPGVTSYEYFGPGDGQPAGAWNGRIARVTSASGAETRFEYDSLGRFVALHEGPTDAPGRLEVRYDDVERPSFVDHGGMHVPAEVPTLPPLPAALLGRLDRSGYRLDTWRGRTAQRALQLQVPIDSGSGSGQELSTLVETRTHDHRGRLVALDVASSEPFAHLASPPFPPPVRTFSTVYHDAAADGRVESFTPEGERVTWLHDAAGRLTHVFSGAGGANDLAVQVLVWPDGRLRELQRNDGTRSLYTWTANGLLESIEHRVGSNTTLRIEHAYDDRNLPLTITETSPGDVVTRSFEHDVRLRLRAETRAVASSGDTERRDYVYAASGNRLSAERRVNGLLVARLEYTYDVDDPIAHGSANDRLVRVRGLDGAGALLATTWLRYENPFGHVSALVTRAAGGDEVSATRFVYAENGSPWLAWDEAWSDLGGGPLNVQRGDVLETRQLHDHARVWRRRSGVDLAPLPGAEWVTRFGSLRAVSSVDAASGELLPLRLEIDSLGHVSGGAAGPSYALYDALGTLRLTSTAGYLSSTAFDAFGCSVLGALGGDAGFAAGWSARHGFGGAPLTSAGVVRLGFRNYAPALGRFLMRDPIGLRGGENVYAYAENRPTALVDALGLAAHGGVYRPPGSSPPWSHEPWDPPIYVPPLTPPIVPPVDEPPDPFADPPGPDDPNFVGPRLPPNAPPPWPPPVSPARVPREGDPDFVGPLPAPRLQA